MYSSYGSYTALTTMSSPLDVSFSRIRSEDSSCAFPSWPRRSSLSESEHEEPHASAFLSDDDLFVSGPFDDDMRSVSSTSSSSSSSPAAAPANCGPPPMANEAFLEREYERVHAQKEYLRQVRMDKERRRQAALKARKSAPKKSPKNKQAGLTTILESGE